MIAKLKKTNQSILALISQRPQKRNNQFEMNSHLIIIYSVALIVVSTAEGVPISLSPNAKYFEAGSRQILTTVYANASDNEATLVYNISFISQKMINPICIFSIAELNFINLNSTINYTLYFIGSQSMLLRVGFTSNLMNKIDKIRINFFVAIRQKFSSTDFLGFRAHWPINRNMTKLTPAVYIGDFSIIQNFNMTGDIKTVVSLLGLSAFTYTDNNSFSFNLNITRSSSQLVYIKAFSQISSPIFIYNFTFTWQHINIDNVNIQGKRTFFYQIYLVNSVYSVTKKLTNIQAVQVNTLFGLRGFSISGINVFNYNFFLMQANTIKIDTSFFIQMIFNYLVTQMFYCSYKNPYLFMQNSLCYQTCPLRSYLFAIDLVCFSCHYDCYTCQSQNDCSTCNETLDFRIFNDSRCIPISGYYDDGNTTAKQCQSNCHICMNNTYCSECKQGCLFANNSCFEVPEQNSQTTQPTLLIGAVAGGVGFIIIIIVGCVIYRKKCKNPQKDQKYIDTSIDKINRESMEQLVLECIICYCQDNLQAFVECDCKHVYHFLCIKQWSQRNPTCPYCRRHMNPQVQPYCIVCKKKLERISLNRSGSVLVDANIRCPSC